MEHYEAIGRSGCDTTDTAKEMHARQGDRHINATSEGTAPVAPYGEQAFAEVQKPVKSIIWAYVPLSERPQALLSGKVSTRLQRRLI